MTEGIQPSGPSQPVSGAQYQDTPGFHDMWDKMFQHHISDEDSAKMTEAFMKMVSDNMNKIFQHALAQAKKRRQEIESGYQS